MMWINLFQIPYQVPMLNQINFFNNFKVIIWQDIQCVLRTYTYTLYIFNSASHNIGPHYFCQHFRRFWKNLLNFLMGFFSIFSFIFNIFNLLGLWCFWNTNLSEKHELMKTEEPDNQANSNALPCWVFFMDFISLWLFNFYSKLSNSKRNN